MSAGRRTSLVAAAALVPTALAGWLVWGVPDAAPGKRPPRPGASGDASPAPSPSARLPLAGRTVVLDPGHNPDNREHVSRIARSVDIGTARKECDTTGTATDSGYAEAAFTLDVSRRVREVLQERGATVRLTHDGDRPFGPCIDERARIGNEAEADAVVSVHADGSTARGTRGFHVIAPAKVRGGDADTARIVAPSRELGADLAAAFADATGSRPANYLEHEGGLVTRGDLGGLNLSRVPKVFLECGNMRDAKEAARFKDPQWRGRAAEGIADGLTEFLTSRSGPDR